MKDIPIILTFLFCSVFSSAQVEIDAVFPAYQDNGRVRLQTNGATVDIRYISGPTSFSDKLGQKDIVSIRGLAAGDYEIDVLDPEEQCEVILSFTIEDCVVLSIANLANGIVAPTDCESADGELDIATPNQNSPTINGGQAPYFMTLVNLEDNERLEPNTTAGYQWSNLSSGTYRLEIEDISGCRGQERVIINSGSGTRANVFVGSDPSCLGQNSGVIFADAIGPNEEVCTLSWSHGATCSEECYLTGLAAGTYTVTVTYPGGNVFKTKRKLYL